MSSKYNEYLRQAGKNIVAFYKKENLPIVDPRLVDGSTLTNEQKIAFSKLVIELEEAEAMLESYDTYLDENPEHYL